MSSTSSEHEKSRQENQSLSSSTSSVVGFNPEFWGRWVATQPKSPKVESSKEVMNPTEEREPVDEVVDEEISFPRLDLSGTDKRTDIPPLGEAVKTAIEETSSRVEDKIEEFKLACSNNFDSLTIGELFDDVVTAAQEFVNIVTAYSSTAETEDNKIYVDFGKTKIPHKDDIKKEIDNCRLAAMNTF